MSNNDKKHASFLVIANEAECINKKVPPDIICSISKMKGIIAASLSPAVLDNPNKIEEDFNDALVSNEDLKSYIAQAIQEDITEVRFCKAGLTHQEVICFTKLLKCFGRAPMLIDGCEETFNHEDY
ncbi:MAG: hypothetical protein LBM93_14405 [Oscillospiraceae bacterium]|jgi:hypothetical protein|nr:hypothetical protein [Oscillospiraceae bacterium]